MSGNSAGALRYFLLNAAIGDIGINLFTFKPGILRACIQGFGRNGRAHGIGVSLAERSGGILYSAFKVHFGMTGSGSSPLAELFQLIQCKASDKSQFRIKHRRHVTGIKEETVATFPRRLIGIEYQKFRIEYIDKIRAAHGTAGMA